MATKIGRIDRGELPTVSQKHPDETRPYSGPIRQNLYNKENKKGYSKQGRINFDRIFRGGDGKNEVEDTLD